MSRIFDRSTLWIIDHRWWTALLLVALSGLAIWGYVDPYSLRRWFESPAERPAAGGSAPGPSEAPPDVDPFRLDADAIVVVDSDDFFTPDGARAMGAVVDALESEPHVESVMWMDRVPVLNIFGLPEPLFPRADASPQRFEAARAQALAHPLVAGQLLSRDARTVLLLVKFDWLFVTSDEDCMSGLREVAERAAAEFSDVDLSFSVTGRVPLYVTAMQSHEANRVRYQVIGYGMILLMAIVLFRGIRAVLIVAVAPCTGVFWTLGMLRFFDWQDNPFNDVILPVLLSLVGFTDGVHLMVQIRHHRARGLSPREAARTALHEVGLACGLTSLTTAIGFGSLSFAHNDIVREFGWCCVIGVVLTFIAVITTIPLLCSTWLGRQIHVGHERGLIDRHLARIGGFVELSLRRPRLMSLVGVLMTGSLTLVSLTLRPDERRSNALPMHSEAAVAMRHLDQALGGLERAEVQISWSRRIAADADEVLAVLREVDEVLRREELIGSPLSLCNFLDALPGERDGPGRMAMLDLLPPPLKRAFYTPEYRQATVSFRVQDLGIARYGPVFERIQDALRGIEQEHPGFTLSLTGSAVRRWRNLYQIVVDLAASLGSAAAIIFGVLALVYRSLRIGLISVIPNVFPLSVAGTYLVLTGQSLEIVSVCAFTVCLGIAVDDTIHFLTRFEEERQVGGEKEDAIRRAFTSVGTALVMTTVVLVAGFSTVLFSDSRDQQIFATMAGLTIASALFGDLFFLPALLARFAGRERQKPRVTV